MKKIIICLVVYVMIFTLCSCGNNNSSGTEQSGVGQSDSGNGTLALTLSQINTINLEGEEFTGYDFPENKLIVLNLWATWCPPCIEELPYLQEVSEYYADKGVEIIGILIDGVSDNLEPDNSVIDAGKELLAEAGANYKVIIPDEVLMNELVAQVQAIPTTFFMDSKGNIVGGVVGSKNAEDWKKEIDGALKKI